MFTSLQRTFASFAILGALLSAAPAVTTNSKLAALDPGVGFVFSSPVYDSTLGTSSKIRTIKRYPSGLLNFSKDYTYNASRYNTPVQIVEDASGNTFVAGYSLDLATGASNIFLLKYANNGTRTWAKPYTTSLLGGRATGLALDSSGNAYVTAFYSPATGGTASIVLKYNSSGTIVASPTFQPLTNTTISNIKIDASNNVFLSGTANNNVAGSPDNALVGRYTTALATVWQTLTSLGNYAFNTGLALDASSNPVTTYGTYNGVTQGIVRKDGFAFGTPLWNQTLSAGNFNASSGPIVDSAGDVAVAGVQYSSFGLAKFDGSTGTLDWNVQQVSSPGFASNISALAQDSAGTYYIGGEYIDNSIGLRQITVPRFDTAGTNLGYIYSAPASQNAFAALIPTTIAGQVYIGGTTRPSSPGTVDYPLMFKISTNTLDYLYWQTTGTTP